MIEIKSLFFYTKILNRTTNDKKTDILNEAIEMIEKISLKSLFLLMNSLKFQ